MIRKILLTVGGISFGTGYYFNKNKVQLSNPYFRQIIKFLYLQDPQYSSFFLKNMIRFSMIKKSEKLHNYVFSSGFDFEGAYLQGLSQLGFDTVQIGPVSLIPSCSQEPRVHFGSKIALANIYSYYQQIKVKNQPNLTRIGVSISPNYEIIKYTPYLIEQNIIQCLKQFQELNQQEKNLLIKRFIIRLDQADIMEVNTPQYLTMVNSLVRKAHQIIKTTENKRKQAFPAQENTQKAEIFMQIPSKEQNSKIYQCIKQIPEVKNVIFNESQYQISRDKNNNKVISMHQGKKRLNFFQLMLGIIKGTL